MHAEARAFVAGAVDAFGPFARVVEFGAADVNGGVRDLFTHADLYVGVDVVDAAGVDVVVDAADWQPDDPASFDCVVCCETFEHTSRWVEMLVSAWSCLRAGGLLIVTAACDPREPHSAVDGWALRDGEHYANIDPADLAAALAALGFSDVDTTTHPRGDVYATARR